jgi:class 3 adenylate cyclase
MTEQIKAQQELSWKILGSGGIALVLALLLSLILSQSLSGPIRELVAGTAEVKQGNLLARVPVRSQDELGKLAASFNDMTAGLAEKEKYRSVLHLVCDTDVARELIDGQVALGGERREVSILFCDVRGFSALTLTIRAEEITRLLNEHMTALTRVVHDHHGVVDKFVGDCVMALFGAPKKDGKDARNAATCALEMIRARAALDQTTDRSISIGVGIATGEVVAGCMGSADRLNYTVLGERVNLAARLCSQAPAGQVFIDEATRNLLGDQITVQPSPPLTLKGWREKVPAFRLLSVEAVHPPHEQAVSHA